jgi:hypothetical protein
MPSPPAAPQPPRDPRIEARTRTSLLNAGTNPREIGHRLRALDAEWDIDRALQVHAAGLSLAGLALGLTVDRRFLPLPLLASALLLQHAVQGWCPPRPALRRMGFRTATEIAEERTALKVQRGDFAGFEEGAPAGHVLAVVRGVE